MTEFSNVLKGVAVASAVFLAACASAPKTDSASAAAAPAMEPAAPAATSMTEAAPAAAPEAAAAPAPNSVEAMIKKMQANRLTLYWRETNSYSFYVGGTVRAEYKPGDSLIVRDESGAENAAECNFALDGALKSGDAAKASACNQLMMTLDQQLQ